MNTFRKKGQIKYWIEARDLNWNRRKLFCKDLTSLLQGFQIVKGAVYEKIQIFKGAVYESIPIFEGTST